MTLINQLTNEEMIVRAGKGVEVRGAMVGKTGIGIGIGIEHRMELI